MATTHRQIGDPRQVAAESDMISKYDRNPEKCSVPADRLGISSRIGMLVLAFALTALVFLFIDSGFRSAADQEDSRRLVRALGLNSLSLVPSGRPLRNPGTNASTNDWRFDPKLGRIPLDGADLVFNAYESE